MSIWKAVIVVSAGCLLAAPARAELAWVPARDGFVPQNAVVGGNESNGERLYVCRAAHNGGFHPGKVRAAFKGCYFGAGGAEHAAPSYEVLVGGPVVWVPAQDGAVPPNAVRGGREGSGETLFICRASFEGGIHSGKLRPAFRGCNISYARKEHTVHQYQVLALQPAAPANPNTAQFDCACLHNRAGRWVPFEYAWSGGKLQGSTLPVDQQVAICQAFAPGTMFRELKVRIDRSNTGGAAYTDYAIKSYVSQTKSCSSVPAQGHYDVEIQPGTNDQFIRIAHRGTASAVPATPAPGTVPSQAAFGCACVNNGAGQPVQFRFKWGNVPFKTLTLDPGMVYAFCWPYGTGAHASPPLEFMLNRATDGSAAFTDYALPRVQSPTNQCSGVPKAGQYWVRFQPGTNNQFLHVTK
jgi:hypothetical protein